MINKLTKWQKQESYFAQTLIDMANETHLVDCTFDQVEKGFVKNEVVVGLWQDGDGYGYMTLKGAKLIKEISDTGEFSVAGKTKIAAVLCVDREQAVKVKNFFGDHDYNA
jgi:hypothetical protein